VTWPPAPTFARADFAQAFFSAMLKRGCLVRPIGATVYFMPPYCINDSEIALLAQATEDTLSELEQGGAAGNRQPALP